jgi:glutamate--cysteine ligase
MPAPTRSLSPDAVQEFLHDQVFNPGRAGHVGIELEWFPPPRTAPAFLRELLPDPLPGASAVTFEPGGQLELSGPPARGIGAAIASMRADTAAARDALSDHGIELDGIGLDPRGARPRVVDAPRYRAMEKYFDTRWPLGRTMMRNTASVQVNLDAGLTPDAVESRWVLAHEIGPMLAAAFANSPFDALGRPTGWRSARLAVWNAIDPSRTAVAKRRVTTAASGYGTYALDAPVMMINVSAGQSIAMRDAITFSRWLDDGHELGWPTLDDFAYHLTTLFPPVRPRGWLELRMIDALPEEWWPVAVAVTAALLDDPSAADAAAEAVAPVRDSWTAAARDSLAVPALHRAAERCFAAAIGAFDRLAVDAETVRATELFHDRYVARGRCPADDLLDNQAAHASTVA